MDSEDLIMENDESSDVLQRSYTTLYSTVSFSTVLWLYFPFLAFSISSLILDAVLPYAMAAQHQSQTPPDQSFLSISVLAVTVAEYYIP